MRYFILISVLSFLCSNMGVQAQSYLSKRNNVWASCDERGLSVDFNGGTAAQGAPTISGGLGWQGNASVCDDEGNLLFYTEGNVVWARNNQVMPNGININRNLMQFGPFGQNSTAIDGVAIVPMPDSVHKYYLFSVQRNGYNHLYCHIVNMRLNNGLGDLEPGGGIEIDSISRGGIHVVPGEDCNFWLVTHKTFTNEFVTYNINNIGIDIDHPVISAVGNLPPGNPDFYGGELNASPDRNKLVQCYASQGIQYAEIHDFNPATGVASNLVALPANPGHACFYAAFSSDGTKLYVGGPQASGFIPATLNQYDLSTPIPWTATALPLGVVCGSRLAPDGKIYGHNYLGPFVDGMICINNPNAAGVACNIVPAHISFANYKTAGLPQEVPELLIKDTLDKIRQVPLCFDLPSVRLTATDTTGYAYKWSVRDTSTRPTRSIKTPGVYSVSYKTSNPCAYHRDTFIVERVDFDVVLGPDSTYCRADTIGNAIEEASYLWQDGSSEPHYPVVMSGTNTYSLRVEKKGCVNSDTVTIKLTNVVQNLGSDTTACRDKPFIIPYVANAPDGADILWSTGTVLPELAVTDTGMYWVTVTDGPCVGTDTVAVNSEWCKCEVSIASAFSPNGDGRNDIFKPIIVPGCELRGYTLLVYNRWGELIYSGVGGDANRGWDGRFNDAPAPIDTYMYVIELKAGSKSVPYYKKGDVALIR